MEHFPDIYDWINKGVIALDVHKKECQHQMLHNMLLPCLKIKILDGANFGKPEFREKAEDFLQRTSPVVFISSPKKQNLQKDWIYEVSTWESIEAFIANHTPVHDYNFLITEMVTGTEDSLTGIAISDGKGSMLIEFYKKPYCVNISPIVSGFSEPKYMDIAHVKNGYLRIAPKKIDIEDIKELYMFLNCKKGYFEFIKGIKNNSHGLFFMEYQDDPAFTRALKLADSIQENPFQ